MGYFIIYFNTTLLPNPRLTNRTPATDTGEKDESKI